MPVIRPAAKGNIYSVGVGVGGGGRVGVGGGGRVESVQGLGGGGRCKCSKLEGVLRLIS